MLVAHETMQRQIDKATRPLMTFLDEDRLAAFTGFPSLFDK